MYFIVLEVKPLELQQNAVMQQQLLIVEGHVRVFKLFFLLESDSQYHVEVHPYQNLRHVVLFGLRHFCPYLKDKVASVPPEAHEDCHAISVRQANMACDVVNTETMHRIVCTLYVVGLPKGLFDDIFKSMYVVIEEDPFVEYLLRRECIHL